MTAAEHSMNLSPERGSVTRSSFLKRKALVRPLVFEKIGHCCGSQSRAPTVPSDS